MAALTVKMGKWRRKTIPLRFILLIFMSLAFPLMAVLPDEVVKIQADYLEYEPQTQILIGEGHVVITQGENRLTGEKLIYHIKEKKIIIHGQGRFENSKQTLLGEEIIYDSLRGVGRASEVFTESDPWVFQAKEVEQLDQETFYASPKTTITTCNVKPLPHYRFTARDVLVYQDERLVSRGVTLFFGNVPVIYLPSFTHALKHRNYFLNVGYDEKYGISTKSGYNYDLNKDHYGLLLLDWWERRGLAKGFKHYFRSGETGFGSLYYYCMKEKEVLFDEELQSYFNKPVPEEFNRTKFAGRYRMNVFSPLNELKVNLDLATDPAIEYELTEESISLIPNRTSSVTLERTTRQYNLGLYTEKIDNYHELDRKYYLYSVQLPKISFATSRLPLFKVRRSRFYHQYQFHFTNKRSWAERKMTPGFEEKDYYEQEADVSFALANTTRLTRRNTLSSSVTLQEEWKDHRGKEDTEDVFISRVLTDVRWRSRLGQFFTNDLSHQTTRRFTEVSKTAYEDYQGVELARFVEKLTFKEPWWRTKLTSTLEYDLRIRDGEKNIYWPEKLSDLVTELETYPIKKVELDSRVVYDPYVNHDALYRRKSYRGSAFLLKEFEVEGKVWLNPLVYFEYRQRRHFVLLSSYADWPSMDRSLYTNNANFEGNVTIPFTEKWRLNSRFEYNNPSIRKRFSLYDFSLYEEEHTLSRDLHCWEIAFSYSTEPDLDSPKRIRKIGFNFNLKAFPNKSNISTEFPPRLFLFQ